MKKVSVITINLDNAEGLRQTILSVIDQHNVDVQYIIIDGASTDNSINVIKEYSDNISFWLSEPDKGVYHAMNKGIKYAEGDYCLFLNSGDCFHNQVALSELLNKSDNEDIIYGNLLVITDDSEYVKTYPDELRFGYFLHESLPHPATLFKKTLFDNRLYNESYKICADWEYFMLSICKDNCTYKHINSTTSVFKCDGLSSYAENKELVITEKQDCLNKHFKAFLADYSEMRELGKMRNIIRVSKAIKYLKKVGFLTQLTV
jgi:glycosyltransferase involved in cell wall biosynthesis